MTATTPATRGERRKARTTGALLTAAEHVFVTRGYHNARVEEIADLADVSVGSVYGHFQSKAGLYLAVAERALALQEEHLEAAFAQSDDPAEQLRLSGEAYLRFYLEHPGYFRLLLFPPEGRGTAATSPAVARLTARASRLVQRLADTVERAVAAGAAKPVQPMLTAQFLWGAWTGVIALHLRADALRLGDDELAAVLEEGRRIVTDGLAR